MFGPLQRLIQRRATKAAEREIEQFLQILDGFDDHELALVAAQAADVCGHLYARGIEVRSPQLASLEWPTLLRDLTSGAIEMRERGEPFRVPGVMVWVHTMRAEQRPEIRRRAKEMWALVERGFEGADRAAFEFETSTGYRLQPDGFLFVPEGYRLAGR